MIKIKKLFGSSTWAKVFGQERFSESESRSRNTHSTYRRTTIQESATTQIWKIQQQQKQTRYLNAKFRPKALWFKNWNQGQQQIKNKKIQKSQISNNKL